MTEKVPFTHTHTQTLVPALEELPHPYFEKNNVAILFSCSDSYAPYVAVTLRSLIEHTSAENNYDILFLHTDISEKNQELLCLTAKNYANISIRFINISALVHSLKLSTNKNLDYISVETFYRLYVGKLFCHYRKLLYLDCDVIVLKDVAELYGQELGNDLLGAVIDAQVAGEYNGATPGFKRYCDEVLQLKAPNAYFQAGVILFNIEELNRTFAPDELMEFAQKRKYIYMDQDVLNAKCQGRVTYLDSRWNIMHDCNDSRISDLIQKAPAQIYKNYMESRRDPYIIHYAGIEKPWNSLDCDMGAYFWDHARRSPFYEMLLLRLNAEYNGTKRRNILKRLLDKNSGARKMADKLLPKGTRRRALVKKTYYALRP